MTARYSYDIDEQSISAYLKDIVDQVNTEQSTSILSSKHYDPQSYASIVKQLAAVVNANYSGDDIIVGDYDPLFIAEVIRRIGSKVAGGGGYVAKAVTCATNTAILAVLTIPDSPLRTISFWTHLDSTALNNCPVVYGDSQSVVLGIAANHITDIGGSFYTTDGSKRLSFGTLDGVMLAEEWQHHFMRVDTNHPAGEKIIDYYINSVSVLDPSLTVDTVDAFTLQNNGLLFVLPDTSTNQYNGISYADFQLWTDQAIAPTAENLARFIKDGKPVDPAVAAAAFGEPAIKLGGDKDTFAVSPFVSTKNLNTQPGSVGPGPIFAQGALVGDTVWLAWTQFAGPAAASGVFEATVTVQDQIQQLSAADLSGTSFLFFAGGNTLTNATTSPSD